MNTAISVLEIIASAGLLMTLAFVVWHVWTTLNKLPEAVCKLAKDEAHARCKSLAADFVLRLEKPLCDLQNVTETLDELREKAANYDQLADKFAARNQAYDELAAEIDVERNTVAALKTEISNAIADLAQTKNALANKSCECARVTDEFAASQLKLRQFKACLPVESVERIYRAVTEECAISDTGKTNLTYVCSRLAVLIATELLEVETEDKKVMIRDAFFSFDTALYTRFMTSDDKDLLASLRSRFERELKPLLAMYVTFHWPRVGEALDLKEHKQDPENGLGVITEVKSAILYSSSGALISRALVRT